jgi:oligoendopeptidase F
MMQALYEARVQAQTKVNWLSRKLGEEKYQPWNSLAPAPIQMNDKGVAFPEALQWIEKSFSGIHPELAEFVRMMKDRNLIEGRVNAKKAVGGYCSSFPKQKLPIVYQSYSGTMSDIVTLAHELGHAFHFWALKEKPFSQQDYPSTLAETASTFGETIFLNDLIQNSTSQEEKFNFVWGEVERFASFTLNIPTRFEFEKNFYEKRKEKLVDSEELCEMYHQAWQKWYGNSIGQTDRYYWAHKLHFSLASQSFYNFPYAYGYLFAMGIYARRKEWGSSFYQRYKDILVDTGVMSCEEIVRKHFGEDITQVNFWKKTLDFINADLDAKIAAL